MSLQAVLPGLAQRRMFICCRVVPRPSGKSDKIPTDPYTGDNIDAQNPATWLTLADAEQLATLLGLQVGIVITEGCGVFCVDVDESLQADGTWSPLAVDICQRFPGAYVEVSTSGKALHIMGSCGAIGEHRTRKKHQQLEVYTRARFILLTGDRATGDVMMDHTANLQRCIADYLPEPVGAYTDEWTVGPYIGWRGGGTDEQIIENMKRRAGAHAVFGGGASFTDLWEGNEAKLAHAFPSTTGKTFDGSAADQALANHLAWATGYDCERVLSLMMRSGLRREKWERDDYMRRTILRAVAGKIPDGAAPGPSRAPDPAGGAAPPPPPPQLSDVAPPPPGSPLTADELAAIQFYASAPPPPPPDQSNGAPPGLSPQGATPSPAGATNWPPPPGFYMDLGNAQRLFDGCIYIEDIHGMLMPDGVILAQRQFDVRFAGYDYQMHVDGAKPTTSAWDAFVDSQVARYPRANGLTFDPRLAPRARIERDGLLFINSWVPVDIARAPGDVSRFVTHIRKMYPVGNDADILLAYLAAICQYKGVKFQWAPLLQGVEGNGKTFLSVAMEYCVGQRYTHHAKAAQLDNRFNSAFYGKLLICVEDVYISEARNSMWETLKPMVTNRRMEIEGKGLDKVTRDVCFNFLMNSNHKDGVRKTRNDRRIAPFFGAQQHEGDLVRDGLTPAYFKELYDWAEKGGGFAAIAEFLYTYAIPDQWNPATHCVRAPVTSSTEQAIAAGRGTIEQEIAEAIDEGRAGFRGGWVNGMEFDRLLRELGKEKLLPRTKRRELIESMGYQLHPDLPAGRVINPLTDGTRPLLYVPKAGHATVGRGWGPDAIGTAYTAAQAPQR